VADLSIDDLVELALQTFSDPEEAIERLEEAIESLEVVIVTEPSADRRRQTITTVVWSLLRGNLARAYWDRASGDRAENIERAIALYEAALIARIRQPFLKIRANAQNNLVPVLSSRPPRQTEKAAKCPEPLCPTRVLPPLGRRDPRSFIRNAFGGRGQKTLSVRLAFTRPH
jgi:hypothetical protein